MRRGPTSEILRLTAAFNLGADSQRRSLQSQRSLQPRQDSNDAASNLGAAFHDKTCTTRPVTTAMATTTDESARRNQPRFLATRHG